LLAKVGQAIQKRTVAANEIMWRQSNAGMRVSNTVQPVVIGVVETITHCGMPMIALYLFQAIVIVPIHKWRKFVTCINVIIKFI
jgi:hypothetical protein